MKPISGNLRTCKIIKPSHSALSYGPYILHNTTTSSRTRQLEVREKKLRLTFPSRRTGKRDREQSVQHFRFVAWELRFPLGFPVCAGFLTTTLLKIVSLVYITVQPPPRTPGKNGSAL